MNECNDKLEFTGDHDIFCPIRNGCCIKECPAYMHGGIKGTCTAHFLVGNE